MVNKIEGFRRSRGDVCCAGIHLPSHRAGLAPQTMKAARSPTAQRRKEVMDTCRTLT